jgi:S1-C subfamily serine protease
LQAEIVRINQDLDLALLKFRGSGFSGLPLGDSNKIQLGEEVYGIGTPASVELGQSVSKGIISGRRKIDEKEYIQTDVKVSPGSSGGPLINTSGEVIGIITWKIVEKGYEGLGFSIPINTVSKGLNLIIK